MARRRTKRSESFVESVADPAEPGGAREIPNLAAPLGEVTEVLPDDRAAFWQRAQDLTDRWPMSDFVGSEFKDDARAHLLVVHEYC